ncbi:C10 family peptidase [Bacteroides acidifaciens]|uniref:C10 family peptidase n=1 Tax=Bacteroides acidifaciens TaxID=85831 RepID=UPI002557CA92|nr:C10 family peptidase [Bacteroides acidifaciens]
MRKNIFIYIILAALISSCTEEMYRSTEANIKSSLYDLSENEALTIAKSFQKSVTASPETRANGVTLGIKSQYRLNASGQTRTLSDENSPLIYEIEMNDGLENGKIIVSGDKRFPEVLAYMPSFNDSLYKVATSPNVMVQMAKNALLDKIQNYGTKPTTRSRPVDSVSGEVCVMIVPFCKTDWGQSSPFNQLLPTAWVQYAVGVGSRPGSAWHNNYYTGEAVVAIAQAMAYLQPYLEINGTYINWEELTMEKDVAIPYYNMAATLSKYIYDTIGTYPVWGKSYNDQWPQSTIVDAVVAMETPINKVSDALSSSQYKITGDRDQKWNLDIVKKSLLSFYPVFVGDLNRVAFLIDGYAINDENTVYFHCNFGRGDEFNGYYMVYDDGRVDFEPGGYIYRDTYLRIIANMRNR